jgi:plasmid replication initiation protein
MGSLIVKDNALINASYNLDLVEQRLVLLAIIEARESQKGINANDSLTVHASSYIQHFNVDKHAAYEALKNACDVLFSRQFSYQERNKNGNIENVKSRWVSEIRYIDKEASVKLIFSPSVVPLITRLEQHFTSYEIEQVRHLSSRYAIRLYELLIQWRSIGKTPFIELTELRLRLGVSDDEYQRMELFKRKILDLSISQINEHTDILVGYEQHKAGRVITGFTFVFTQKPQPKNATPQTKPKVIPTKNTDETDIDALLKNDDWVSEHAHTGESWEHARARLRLEAATGKFSLAPTN